MSVVQAERIPVRIPMGGGEYSAIIVVEHQAGLEGYGEAPIIQGRGDQALEAAHATARLDLAARLAGVPLAELLGGVRRAQVECSALITEARPDRLAREVERLAGAGFGCFKLKAANRGGMLDQERLGAARWAAGRQARLRLDLNGRLTFAEAAGRLPSLAGFHLELVEQPLSVEAHPAQWAALAAVAGVPLAADESLPGWGEELKAAGIGLAVKLATVGGAQAAFDLARAAAGPVTIGSSYETSIGLAAALHVACALADEPLACGLATVRRLDADLGTGLDAGGPLLVLPPGPGLGVGLDRRLLELYRVDR